MPVARFLPPSPFSSVTPFNSQLRSNFLLPMRKSGPERGQQHPAQVASQSQASLAPEEKWGHRFEICSSGFQPWLSAASCEVTRDNQASLFSCGERMRLPKGTQHLGRAPLWPSCEEELNQWSKGSVSMPVIQGLLPHTAWGPFFPCLVSRAIRM